MKIVVKTANRLSIECKRISDGCKFNVAMMVEQEIGWTFGTIVNCENLNDYAVKSQSSADVLSMLDELMGLVGIDTVERCEVIETFDKIMLGSLA